MNEYLQFESDVSKFILKEYEISEEIIRRKFIFSERRMLSVVEENGQFLGIITFGDYMKYRGHIIDSFNRNCFSIELTDIQDMLEKAEYFYREHKIDSDIPVVDRFGRIAGVILNNRPVLERKRSFEERIVNLKNKINYYKKSVYLKDEITAFVKVLSVAKICVRNIETFKEIETVVGEKLGVEVVLLTDDEYFDLLEQYEKGVDKSDQTALYWDFDFNNRENMYYSFPLYEPGRLLSDFSYAVENNEFSRIVKITERSSFFLEDGIRAYNMSSITISAYSFYSKYVYEYLIKYGHNVLFNISFLWAVEAYLVQNGVKNHKKDTIPFWWIDKIAEQYALIDLAKKRNIKIYNVEPAVKCNLTKNEKYFVENYINSLEKMISGRYYEQIESYFSDDALGDTKQYIKKLIYQYPAIRRVENDLIVNKDYNSEFIHCENGVRRTCYQPDFYYHTIYVIGPCIALSPFTEDAYTIPSLLSKLLTESGYHYRVVNMGLLAVNTCERLFDMLCFQEGDVIINLFTVENKKNVEMISTSEAFDNIVNRQDMFVNTSFHCNRKANEIYAGLIFDKIRESLKKEDDLLKKENTIWNIFKPNYTDLDLYDFSKYIQLMEKYKVSLCFTGNRIGSIVMNANPFTLGHLHLIEYASKNCDWLYVFVVQEDGSYFEFEDRFKIVQSGCQDIKNITILPSGRMVVSKITFSTYFLREEQRDLHDLYDNKESSLGDDLRVFATYVAPVLNINMRFVGEEPVDYLTRQYNERMKELFPIFGIDLIEIPRKTLPDGEVVSASAVRRLFKSQKFDEMKRLLPDSTYRSLLGLWNKYKNKK